MAAVKMLMAQVHFFKNFGIFSYPFFLISEYIFDGMKNLIQHKNKVFFAMEYNFAEICVDNFFRI